MSRCLTEFGVCTIFEPDPNGTAASGDIEDRGTFESEPRPADWPGPKLVPRLFLSKAASPRPRGPLQAEDCAEPMHMILPGRIDADPSRGSAPGRMTVLLPVYRGDHAAFFSRALDSVIQQEAPADEILVVADGPLSEDLDRVIMTRQERSTVLRVLRLPRNQGLARALNEGVCAATGEMIARMDADDISHPARLAKQAAYLALHPDVALLGTQIREFHRLPDDGCHIRHVPMGRDAILRFAKTRNPFNHVSVVFRRQAVMAVGNYENWPRFEDYHLWAKLISAGYEVANLDEVLVYVRTSGLYGRRGGLSYARSEWAFRRELARLGIISPIGASIASIGATGVRILPNSAREQVYNRFLRLRSRPSR